MAIQWDGLTKSSSVKPEYSAARHDLAEAARHFDWPRVLDLVDASSLTHVNAWRLDGKSFFTPLHHAAYGNAPVEVVCKLVALGGWRTLRNSTGERPVDIAQRKNHLDLLKCLEPVYVRQAPLAVLRQIQENFHSTIRERATELVEKESLRLPELEVLLELAEPKMWFPVPGMYGGFNFWLDAAGDKTTLIVESWCRVVEGSGQRHKITADGSVLVAQGFV